MELVDIRDIRIPDIVGRSSYTDVGEISNSYAQKMDMLYASKGICNKLWSYMDDMRRHGFNIGIYGNVCLTDIFYLGALYFRVVLPNGYVWNVNINLKSSVPYLVLIDMIKRGKFSKKALYLYEIYWRYLFKDLVKKSIDIPGMASCSSYLLEGLDVK